MTDVLADAERLCGVSAEADPGPVPDDEIDLAALLDEIAAFVRRFVVLKPAQASVIALWIAHTHAIEVADVTPFLAVTSAEMRSGKTRLLEVLELAVRKAWRAVFPSEAVLYRKIERDHPTLLLDEVDAIFNAKGSEHEGLRSLLNAGNRRGTVVSRCLEKGADLKDFSIFCPRALAGIGKLPATVADRSIPIRLERRAPDEAVAPFYFREVQPEAATLRARLEALVTVGIPALRVARPERPEALDDRAADGAEPLLAIADLAGGEWPERSRRSLIEIYGSRPKEESARVRLLADLRTIFDGTDLPSARICELLAEDETSPWGAFDRGKPITPRALARLLREFDVFPKNLKIKGDDGRVLKGYLAEQLENAFRRYLPSSSPEAENPLPRYLQRPDGLFSVADASATGKRQ